MNKMLNLFFFTILLVLIKSSICYNSNDDPEHHGGGPELKEWFQYARCLLKCYENCNSTGPNYDQFSHLNMGIKCQDGERCKLDDSNVKNCSLNETEINTIWEDETYPVYPLPYYHCTARSIQNGTNTLYFRMEYEYNQDWVSNEGQNFRGSIPLVFIVEVEQNGGNWTFHSIESDWLIPLNVTPGNSYRVRITGVSGRYIFTPQVSELVRVYDASEIQPIAPKKIQMERETREEIHLVSSHTRNVRFYFESQSGTNASCTNEYALNSFTSDTIKKSINPMRGFYFGFNDFLWFGRNVTVFVRELPAEDYLLPSSETAKDLALVANATFLIPECFVFRDYSFLKCAPPEVRNLRLQNLPRTFRLTWNDPEYTRFDNQINTYFLSVWIPTARKRDCQAWAYRVDPIYETVLPGNVTFVDVQKSRLKTFGKILFCLNARSEGGYGPYSPIEIEYAPWSFRENQFEGIPG